MWALKKWLNLVLGMVGMYTSLIARESTLTFESVTIINVGLVTVAVASRNNTSSGLLAVALVQSTSLVFTLSFVVLAAAEVRGDVSILPACADFVTFSSRHAWLLSREFKRLSSYQQRKIRLPIMHCLCSLPIPTRRKVTWTAKGTTHRRLQRTTGSQLDRFNSTMWCSGTSQTSRQLSRMCHSEYKEARKSE